MSLSAIQFSLVTQSKSGKPNYRSRGFLVKRKTNSHTTHCSVNWDKFSGRQCFIMCNLWTSMMSSLLCLLSPLEIYSVLESCPSYWLKTWLIPWLFYLLIWNRVAYGQSHTHTWLDSEKKSISSSYLLIQLQPSFRGRTLPPLLPADTCGGWQMGHLSFGQWFWSLSLILSFLLSICLLHLLDSQRIRHREGGRY